MIVILKPKPSLKMAHVHHALHTLTLMEQMKTAYQMIALMLQNIWAKMELARIVHLTSVLIALAKLVHEGPAL